MAGADLVWENSIADWWLTSQANTANTNMLQKNHGLLQFGSYLFIYGMEGGEMYYQCSFKDAKETCTSIFYSKRFYRKLSAAFPRLKLCWALGIWIWQPSPRFLSRIQIPPPHPNGYCQPATLPPPPPAPALETQSAHFPKGLYKRGCLVCEKIRFAYCSTFRCYLIINV